MTSQNKEGYQIGQTFKSWDQIYNHAKKGEFDEIPAELMLKNALNIYEINNREIIRLNKIEDDRIDKVRQNMIERNALDNKKYPGEKQDERQKRWAEEDKGNHFN